MKAPTAEMRLLWAEDIERCREHFQTAAAQGWLDTTPRIQRTVQVTFALVTAFS
jgi:hypothetical protein